MYIVVTGALSGIGKETVTHLAENNWNVIACVERDCSDFKKFSNNLSKKTSQKIEVINFDLGDEESIINAAKKIKSLKVDLKGLVNIAGITKDSSVLMTSSQDLKHVNDINFFGPVVFTQYFIKLTQRSDIAKSVVFISSISALDGIEGMLSYGTSKNAIVNAARVFSRELGDKNYRFNVIAPGVIDTKMNEKVPSDILEKRIASTSLRRIGSPKEVSKVIEFLISDYSSFITGQTIRVDGGIG